MAKKAKFSREYKVFLELLRAERKAANLTQDELAKRLRQKQGFVSKCESGQRRVDMIEARRFCIALGTSFAEFVKKVEATIEQAAPVKRTQA